VRPYDVLVVFKQTLAPGSTHLKVYETEVTKTQKGVEATCPSEGGLRRERETLKSTIRESKLQRQTQIENEFNHLDMGCMPQSALLAEWDKLLEALDDAGTYFRDVVSPVSPEAISGVASSSVVEAIRFDGGPPRKPVTGQECAECVAHELESRADPLRR
jgi:hypothetical protein